MNGFCGRKNALGKLGQAYIYAQKCEAGAVLVSGPAGAGKTALVTRFAVDAERNGALFAYGKADAALDSTPYSTVAAAMNMLVKKAIAENPDDKHALKEAVRQRLDTERDGNLAPLFSLVPALAYLISYHRRTIEQGESNTHSTNLRLRSLLEAVAAARNRPLVLFLDDLQWMDAASHGFVRYLAVSGGIANLLLVMAHRKDDTRSRPDLAQTTGLYQSLDTTRSLPLSGMTKMDTRALLAWRLASGQNLIPLADLCHEKTAGNPLYLTRLLDELLEKGVIFKDNGEWVYDIDHISNLSFTENVADLIIRRINHLEGDALALLKQAACIQGYISVRHLMATSGYSREKIETLLWKPVRKDLLRKTQNGFAFAHDKILESVQALLGDEEVREIHGRLVAFYLAAERRDDLEANIFTLLYHYSFYCQSVSDPLFRKTMSGNYFMAGENAQCQSAYDLALAYFVQGKSHYPGDIWTDDYDLALRFCRRMARCAYLAGDFDAADRIFKEVDAQALCNCDRLPTELIKIPCYHARHKEEQALATGLAMLRRLGINIPENPSKPAILMPILKAWLRFAFSRKARLERKRLDPDSDVYKAVQCLSALGAVVYFLSPERLLPLIMAKGFNISLKYGNMAETPAFYMMFGMILNEITGGIKWGRRLGAIARTISAGFGDDHHKIKELTLGNVFLDHWDKSMAQGIGAFEDAETFCLKQGDHEFFGYNALLALHGKLICSMPLDKLGEQIAEKKKMFQRINNQFALTTASFIQQAVANLTLGVPKPWILNGEYFEEARLDDSIKGLTTDCYLYKFYMAVYHGRTDKASEIQAILGTCDEMAIDAYQYCYYQFLSALVDIDRQKGVRKIRRHVKRLKKYASQNEAIYRSKYLLVLAASLRLKGKSNAAAVYRDALAAAERHGFRFEQALACEGLGKMAKDCGDEAAAREHMKQAVGLYRAWGMKWKQGVFNHEIQENQTREAVRTGPEAVALDQINWGTRSDVPNANPETAERIDDIFAAMQRISQATAVHAAARMAQSWKCCVYMDNRGIHWPATFTFLPEKMLNFASATNEVLLANAKSIDTPYFDTAYFWRKRPTSLMVVPIGKDKGVYFENCKISPNEADLIRLARRLFACIAPPDTADLQLSGTPKSYAVQHKENCTRIQEYILEKEPYKNPKLTLADVAGEVKLSQRAVTDAIKMSLGQNFRTFVNSYRVEAVKKALKDSANHQKTILEIAFDQGFNSKSTFNDVFKQFVGTTPSTFMVGMADKNGTDRNQVSR